jgi:hypothetical protein
MTHVQCNQHPLIRKKVYRVVDELPADLDEWMRHCNEPRSSGPLALRKDVAADLPALPPPAPGEQQIGEAA